MNKSLLTVLLCLFTGSVHALEFNPFKRGNRVASLDQIKLNLAFTCAYEKDHLPPLNEEADLLFKYGRWLETQPGKKEKAAFAEIGRLYRIANAYGHYKANNNLQTLVSTGRVDSLYRPDEVYDLTQQLIAANIPFGYYFMGYYLERGYGVKQNKELALKYYRKAADMGNPDGLHYVGNMLRPIDVAPEIAKQMLRCAAEQGHAKASNDLGYILKYPGTYPDALQAFHWAAKAGHATSSYMLAQSFDNPSPPQGDASYLAVQPDSERSRRYKAIEKFFDKYEILGKPTVPDIDQIVPLPPAKLPAWDGTFQWEKEYLARKAPPQPSEELIVRMARDKHLDPATGLPLKK